MQTGRAGKKLFYCIAAMSFAIIQQHDQVTGYLTQQMAEEFHHFFAMDVILV